MTPFRIGHIGTPPHPSFAATMDQDPLLQRVEIPMDAPLATQVAMLRECDGYYVIAARDELPRPLHVHRELLAQLPNLLMAASGGAGYDTLDPASCTEAGVLLVNQAGGNARGVAEHAVGMMLACLKRIPESHARMKAGTAADRNIQMGRELSGRTVGLVGCGHIGTLVSAMLRAAFGCRILAADPALDDAALRERGAEKADLPTLLREADVVSLHCPLSPDTRGMMGAAQFAAMKPGAVFVTTARGSIHDEDALLAALESGHLAGAGLDVWAQEPPPPAHPLLHHPAVIASQHIAGVTHESRSNITRIAALAFGDLAAGRLPPRIVNPAAIPGFEARWKARLAR